MKLIMIGGGSIGHHGSEPTLTGIDKEIILQSGKANPTILLLPTAGTCQEAYFRVFKRHFKSLGAVPKVLYLKGEINESEIEETIMASDAIYVGGGSTQVMMSVWREYGVDKLLLKFAESGKVLSGLSAGAICWFEKGVTDSKRREDGSVGSEIINGLGLVKAVHCPHFNLEAAKRNMKELLKGETMFGIGIEDNCALEVIDDSYRIITSKQTARTYKLFWRDNEYFCERLGRFWSFCKDNGNNDKA
jgi:dipeptidase E